MLPENNITTNIILRVGAVNTKNCFRGYLKDGNYSGATWGMAVKRLRLFPLLLQRLATAYNTAASIAQ